MTNEETIITEVEWLRFELSRTCAECDGWAKLEELVALFEAAVRAEAGVEGKPGAALAMRILTPDEERDWEWVASQDRSGE